VIDDCLKLTTYFGERDRTDGGFLADALVDLYERRAFQTSIVMRGVAGFGIKHHLQTAHLLTLSEDLPLVSIAVDTHERIESALEDISSITTHGLVTLERARMLTGRIGPVELPQELHEATKLTVYVGRQQSVGQRPAHVAIVDALREHGVAGATVFLGVDGTAHGVRQRARFFSRNADVPLMIISVGDGAAVARALADLGAVLHRPLLTLERVRVCKRDGVKLAEPQDFPATDSSGLGIWQKLMVYAGEQARHHRHPLYLELVQRLRRAGAAGATALRGVWGYHGNHEPHGDRFWSLRRDVPVLTVIVDTPERTRRWFAIVDELTDEAGLVTSEMVPAFRATGPQIERGGFRLARRH
jgi:PII-like signaling protein